VSFFETSEFCRSYNQTFLSVRLDSGLAFYKNIRGGKVIMHKGRLEAFSDGVIAIIITIMVLELKVPHGDTWSDLLPLGPVLLSYFLSFVFVGIYWNNHHHMLQATKSVNGNILWANLHLLFWLSLIPFTTGWMGENHFGSLPVAIYGVNLLASAVSYYILSVAILTHQGRDSEFAKALGSDFKGKISLVIYSVAVAIAWADYPIIAYLMYQIVAIIWLIPDRRIEKRIQKA
jgi:uncharacterized membrane protein